MQDKNLSTKKELARRQKRQKLGRFLAWAMIAFCVVSCVIFSYLALHTLFLSNNPHFALREVNFSSDGLLKEKTVLEKLSLSKGKNIFELSPREIRQGIEKDIAVKSAEVRRYLPGRLEIKVFEKNPLARFRSGLILSDAGDILPAGRKDLPYLPILIIAKNLEKQPGEKFDSASYAILEAFFTHLKGKKLKVNDRVYAYSDILKPSYLILAKEGELHLILRRNDKFRLRGNAKVKLSQKKLELSLDRSVRAIVEDGNTRRSISLVDATLQSTLVR